MSTSAWSTHTTLTFTPATQGDYLVIGAAAIACDNAGGRVGARLNHSNASTYGGRDCYVKSDYERRVFAVSPKINLNAVSNTSTLQYHSPDNATGVTCAYSAILALRLDGFEAAYTNQDFSASPINTAQTSYQDALTMSATPAAVAHLIIGTGGQRINATVNSGYQQLISDNPSATFAEYTQEGVNTASYYGLGLAAVMTPAASAANWKWQYKCEASSTAYAADLAIAVLQLEAGSTTFTGTAAPRWSWKEKAQIVAETLAPRAVASAIARRYGLHRNQLYAWRKELREAADADEVAGSAPLDFVPVVVAEECRADRASAIKIELSGARVRVAPGVDAALLADVLRTLKALG